MKNTKTVFKTTAILLAVSLSFGPFSRVAYASDTPLQSDPGTSETSLSEVQTEYSLALGQSGEPVLGESGADNTTLAITTLNIAALDTIIEADGITYKILSLPQESSKGTVQVGNGSTAITVGSSNLTIPDTIAYEENEYSVVAIGYRAFMRQTSLKTIFLPDSLTSVGESAFWGSGLTEITLPDTVNTVGKSAFANCTSLKTAVLSSGMTEIPQELFSASSSEYGYETVLSSVTIPEGITSIGQKAFLGCEKLKTIEIPASVTVIGESAFKESKLTAVNFAANSQLEEIGAEAFLECTSLTEITLPEGLRHIRGNAFKKTGLKTAALPSSLETLEYNTFSDCSSLTAINVGAENTYFESVDGVLFTKGMQTLLNYPIKKADTNYTIPANVETILKYAFNKAANLETLSFGSAVTTVENNAFEGASKLKNVTMGNSVTSMGKMAFYNNSALESLVLSDNITEIAQYSIYNCSKLKAITMPANLTKINSGGISGIASDAIYTVKNVAVKAVLVSYGISEANIALTNTEPEPVSEFTVDGLLYTVLTAAENGTPGTVQLGNGKTALAATDQNLTILASVEHQGKSYNVTTIGSRAFMDNDQIRKVTISSGITKIDNGAFMRSSLTSIVIPDSVEEIGANAFMLCQQLGNISLPANLTKISEYTFSACKMLNSIVIPEGVLTIEANAFNQCESLTTVSLPASLQEIGDSAFWSLEALHTVNIASGSNLKKIGIRAFNFCSALTTIALPQSLESVGENAFQKSSNLVITFPQGSKLNYLGDSAFGSTQMKQFMVPATLTNFNTNALNGCTKLTSITVEEGNPSYSSINGVLFDKGASTLLKYPASKAEEEYTVPSSVRTVGVYAFHQAANLEKITVQSGTLAISSYAFQDAATLKTVILPDSITSIGKLAFYNCSNLRSVRLPAGVEEIVDNLFYNCPKLTSIAIPTGVKTINSNAFGVCAQLSQITIESALVTSIASGAFSGVAADAVFTVKTEAIKGLLANSGIAAANITVDNTTPQPIAEFTVNNIVYKVLADPIGGSNGTVKASNGDAAAGQVVIPGTVQNAGLTYDVIEIGNNLFYNNSKVTSITISENVVAIGDHAIHGCGNVLDVKLPASLERIGTNGISSNIKLRSITFAQGSKLKELSNGSLSDNMALTSIVIPKSVTTTHDYVLGWNYGLKSVTFEEGSPLTKLSKGMFFRNTSLETAVLPTNITVIEEEAFYSCGSLQSIDLEKITQIGENAFYDCASLKSVVISDKVQILESGTFFQAKSLETLVIGQGVTEIGELISHGEHEAEGVFDGTISLRSVIIPANVRVIGKNAFKGAEKLELIELQMDVLENLGANAFYLLPANAKFYVKNQAVKDMLITRGAIAADSIIIGILTTNKVQLVEAINKAAVIGSAGYTAASYQALQQAISAARSVNSNTAATQAQVNQAVANLTNAVAALVPITAGETNKEQLYLMLSLAEQFVKAQYTATSYAALQEAVIYAQAVYDSPKADQFAADSAAAKLKAAVLALVPASVGEPANKEALHSSLILAKSIPAQGYTTFSYGKMEKAIVFAQAIFDNPITAQGTVDQATNELTAAILALSKISIVDRSDSSSGGGSSGGSGSRATTGSSTTSETKPPLPSLQHVESVLAASTGSWVNINARNQESVSFSDLRAMMNTSKKQNSQNPKTVFFVSDIVENGKVLSRISLDSSKVVPGKGTFNLGIALNDSTLQRTFEKFYNNEMQFVSFAQQDSWGMEVKVSVKLDLSKLDTTSLRFYSYDKKTNTYAQLTAPSYWVDTNGYLHFSTAQGKDVVVTDYPLTRK